MLPRQTRGWVVFPSTAQGRREPWHCSTATECPVLARLLGALRVSLVTCTRTPRCVLWLENSPTKCHPTYSLITLCPIAPPQEQRQTTTGRNKSCPRLPKAQGKEFWARAGGESRPPPTQASSAQHCYRCYQLQNGLEPLEFHYTTADEQWCRSAAAGAASSRVDSATFTAAKITGQKSIIELSYKLITAIKLNITILLQALLVQACHTPQKPAALPSLPQHVPCH